MIPALMATVFIGGYTDNGGRKIGLISPIIGGIVQIYLLLCTEIFHLPIWFILIGGFLEGLSGGIAMFLMAAFSYISDKTSRSQRSLRIIILEMVIGCSSTISFLLSGYMIQTIGFLGTTLVLHVIVVLDLCVVFMMPESLPANEHAKFWTLKHFKNSINVYTTDDTSGKRRLALLTSLLILFFLIPARLGTDSVQILFMLNRPLCWDSAFIGYFKGLYYLTSTIGSILLTKLAQPKFGDLQLLIVGCISAVLHLVFWAFVKTSLMMFLVPLLGIFCSLPIGMLRAFSSKIVSPHELGAMFSWIASMEQIGVLVGNVGFTAIYTATLLWHNGFVFIAIAICYFCGGVVAV
ncbi:hypothetical protein LSH36_8g14067 [Paralvinella palmiformis]|uniref:Major facilitator superfamily (MFS) profile domain-containing protein n=1 Tax=Paralvinella palmiformis TaxID=53620 RepID=A0AAD9KE97_9ANNE|nr:hypothetical protein LSH36_8g14067 [Paralvinella palmiformis]